MSSSQQDITSIWRVWHRYDLYTSYINDWNISCHSGSTFTHADKICYSSCQLFMASSCVQTGETNRGVVTRHCVKEICRLEAMTGEISACRYHLISDYCQWEWSVLTDRFLQATERWVTRKSLIPTIGLIPIMLVCINHLDRNWWETRF